MKSTVVTLAFLLTLSGYSGLAQAQAKPDESAQIIEVKVTEKGFEPNTITVDASKPVILKINRKTDATCATSISVPSQKVKRELPLNQDVVIRLGKLDKGDIKFGCGMNMITGVIHAQ